MGGRPEGRNLSFRTTQYSAPLLGSTPQYSALHPCTEQYTEYEEGAGRQIFAGAPAWSSGPIMLWGVKTLYNFVPAPLRGAGLCFLICKEKLNWLGFSILSF